MAAATSTEPDLPHHARPGRRRGASPRPAPDAYGRRRPAAPRRLRVRRHAGARRLLGLRQRGRRGVDGRRDRRLVRGDRALQAPAGPADPAHRADPASARTSWARGSRSSSGRTSCRRTSSASGSRRRRSRRGSATGSATPPTPAASSTRCPTWPRSRSARCATTTSPTWSPRRFVPRFREEPISPLLGTTLMEVLRDDLHHGVVDLVRRGDAPLAGRQPGDLRPGAGGAGAVVGAAQAQRRGDHADPRRGGRVGRGHPRRPAPPRPRGARLDAGPARPRPAQRRRDAGPRRGLQGCGCSTTRRS